MSRAWVVSMFGCSDASIAVSAAAVVVLFLLFFFAVHSLMPRNYVLRFTSVRLSE